MTFISRLSLLIFLFLAALFLSAEIWMQAVRHTSFCTTSSCDVVGEYVRFGEGNLIKMGAYFFWMLWALVFFGGRYQKPWLWGLASLGLFGALAFDGALLGFQFIGLREQCLICIAVGAILFGILFLFSWVRRSFLTALLGIAVWMGGFTANAILDLGVIPPADTDTAFVHFGNSTGQGPRHIFFFSLHCDHCATVLANLSINTDELEGSWHLACVDNKEDDLYRLAHILDSKETAQNPFLEILRIETLSKVDPIPIPQELRQAVRQARAYFKMRNFLAIPILVVQERPGWEMVLRGEGNITEYLRTHGYLERELFLGRAAPIPEKESTQSGRQEAIDKEETN